MHNNAATASNRLAARELYHSLAIAAETTAKGGVRPCLLRLHGHRAISLLGAAVHLRLALSSHRRCLEASDEQATGMENQYAQGTLIWIKHEEEVWIQAEIITSNEKETIVKTDDDPDARIVLGPNEPIFLRTSDVFTAEGLSVLDDLTQLTHLHEPAVLSSLQNRFDIDKIYTFTGPILIALNPFKSVRGLYDEDVLRSFMTTEPISKPHVFNTSNSAYRGICDRQKSQTVLISGESGAGKTETTKFVMKFLAMAGSEDGNVTNVEKQVLESNPLLEAFGNARTLRNDNSSRFGKFIELQFKGGSHAAVSTGMAGVASRLCGARIRTYLLEKVRVADQQEGERNYHIFYEACAAAGTLSGTTVYNFPQILSKDRVKSERPIDLEGFSDLGNFAYLTRSTCRTLKDVNDTEMFERRIAAMQTIGIEHGPPDIPSPGPRTRTNSLYAHSRCGSS